MQYKNLSVTKFGKTFQIVEWTGQDLPSTVYADTETKKIEFPDEIPDLVLTVAYTGEEIVYWIRNENLVRFLEALKKSLVVFHTATFDIPVIEKASGLSFDDQLLANKVMDIAILYRSIFIATKGLEAKKYALDALIKEFLNEELEKDDEIRLTFGQFIENGKVNYEKISAKHFKYAALDTVATGIIHSILMQKMKSLPTSTNLSHQIQLLGEIALGQIARNGIQVDLEYKNKIEQEFLKKKDQAAEVMAIYGLQRGKGFQTAYEKAVKFFNLPLPLTSTGKLSSAVGELEKFSGNPFIKSFLDFKGVEKQINFLTLLNSERVYPRYDSMKVTLRTSCKKPNIQQMPRTGGIRECFIPKPGHVFIDLDYSAIELASIASICKKVVGYSVLGDVINSGKCPHRYAAANIYKVNYDSIEKKDPRRQVAKILNFGLVADMAPLTFVHHAASQGVIVTEDEAIFLKDEWSSVYHEMRKYWRRAHGRSQCVTRTGFVRSNCSYTEFLNTPMQSLCAEGAKLMLYFMFRSPYKVVAFVHDQILVEIEEERAAEALPIISNIMIDAMSKVIPDIKISVEGEICSRFKK